MVAGNRWYKHLSSAMSVLCQFLSRSRSRGALGGILPEGWALRSEGAADSATFGRRLAQVAQGCALTIRLAVLILFPGRLMTPPLPESPPW